MRSYNCIFVTGSRSASILSLPHLGRVSTLHNVRVVDKSHTYIMYSPVAISDARRLAATPYRLFGARRPVARVCHPPGSPPQRWSIHTGAVSRPPQSKSKGVALAARMALLSANELRDVPLPAGANIPAGALQKRAWVN